MDKPDTDHQADEPAAVAKPEAQRSGPTRSSFDIVIVGGGIFNSGQVTAFDPGQNEVILEDGSRIAYKALVAAPRLTLRWIYWNMMLRGQEVLARPASTGNKR
jgi:hypothetical protein